MISRWLSPFSKDFWWWTYCRGLSRRPRGAYRGTSHQLKLGCEKIWLIEYPSRHCNYFLVELVISVIKKSDVSIARTFETNFQKQFWKTNSKFVFILIFFLNKKVFWKFFCCAGKIWDQDMSRYGHKEGFHNQTNHISKQYNNI